MSEIIVIVILNRPFFAAPATDIKCQLYKAALMHEALFHFTLLIQLILETPYCFSSRLVYKAAVYKFEYRIIQLSRVPLDIQVKK